MNLGEKYRKFMKENERIINYFKPYWKVWLVIILIANFLTLLELINPLIVKFLIDTVLIEKNFDMLNMLMFAFIGIGLLTVALQYTSAYLQRRFSLSILFDVRNRLFNHIERLDMHEFRKKTVGDFLSRLTEDIEAIGEYVNLIFQTLLMNVLMVAIIFSISIMLHWQLTLLAMIIVPLMIYTQKHYGNNIRKLFEKFRQADANFLNFLQERLTLIPLIKIFAKEKREFEKQKSEAKKLIAMDLNIIKIDNFAAVVVGMMIFYALLFVLWYGGLEVIRGALTVGTLVAIYTYIGMLFGPIQTLADLNIDMQTTLVSVKRVFSVLDIKPKVVDKKGAKELEDVKGAIQFKNVTFGYEKDKTILNNMNLDIKPGEVIGVVGTSGSGKSTIARLLTRLYDPEKGEILVDGKNIKDVKIDSLKESIAYMKQDVMLFQASVKENLSYGKPDATQKEIQEAAKLAHAHSFIMKLKKKYNTLIGVEGVELSGGEAQRISIARALLKDAQIILLDEATSALDVETEVRVQDSIKKVSEGKTMIIIAHRLSTLNIADRILVLDKGRIVEKGTFEQLMKRKGLFYKLHVLQRKKIEEKTI